MSRLDVICVGAVNLDTIAVVEVVPGSDARTTSETIIEAGGGPAATAAVALARLGVSVGFCGVVGDDAVGEVVRKQFEDEGVDTSWLRARPGETSARSIVLAETTTGARTIVAGRTPPLNPDDIPVDKADWLHVDQAGYGPLMQAAASGSRLARVSLDAGNPIDGLSLARVDLYAPTIDALLSRHPGHDIESAMRLARHEGPSAIVATAGSAGAYVLTNDTLAHIPAFTGRITSTIGAGDVFHGALLAALVQGFELETATRRASATAVLSCRSIDGRSGIPTLQELDEFLRSTDGALSHAFG